MGSRANISLSATSSIDYSRGLSLKSRVFKAVLKKNGITQREMAELIGMKKRTMRRKLYRREKFTQKEIEHIVYALGARAAIEVIWFPTIEEKLRIKKYIWEEQTEVKIYGFIIREEKPARTKQMVLEQQIAEDGEDWEQTEEFEDYISSCTELPSKRFMRRRKNGER